MSHVVELDHPVVNHHLLRLREKSTPPDEFRRLISRLAGMLVYEATRDLKASAASIETPLCSTTGLRLSESIGLVPILRAGLGMLDAALDQLPAAEVWHLGLYRDEATARPVEYYSKLPESRPVDVGLVLDPMLATGGSATAALHALKRWGVGRAKLLSIIAARDGIRAIQAQFPDVQVYACAIDPELNANKFIVPGLGDAGDRTFNTTQR